MTRPGVYVSEAPLPRVQQPPSEGTTYGAFIGTALRGPIEPTLVTSWSDFVANFGSAFVGTLPVAISQFLANGGGAAYVCRVAGSTGAIAATADISDSTEVQFTATAQTPGAWGNAVSLDVVPENDTSSDTFALVVYENERGVSIVKERFNNLSFVSTSPRFIETIINSSTIGSRFITVANAGTGTTWEGPGKSAQALSTGADGTGPVAGDWTAAFALFDELDVPLVVYAPPEEDGSINPDLSGLDVAVAARGDSLLVCDTGSNQAPDGIDIPALPSGNSYVAAYYPWIHISDPAPDAPRGATRLVPSGASAAGQIIATEKSRGVFQAPAGLSTGIANAVANERRLTNLELDDLAGQNINVVRAVPGAGIAIMGARTRSNDSAKYISVRRTLNFVKSRAVSTSRFALFEPNTPELWEQLRVANGTFLSDLWQAGGLAGETSTQAFYVKADEDNNTAQTIANGEVHVEIGVAPVFPAEYVIIRVGQFESGTSVVVVEEV